MENNNLVTIDTNNYEAMAKAMGIAGEGTKSSDTKKTQQRPRFRIPYFLCRILLFILGVFTITYITLGVQYGLYEGLYIKVCRSFHYYVSS